MSNLGFKRHMGVKGTGEMYQTAAKGFTKIQRQKNPWSVHKQEI